MHFLEKSYQRRKLAALWQCKTYLTNSPTNRSSYRDSISPRPILKPTSRSSSPTRMLLPEPRSSSPTRMLLPEPRSSSPRLMEIPEPRSNSPKPMPRQVQRVQVVKVPSSPEKMPKPVPITLSSIVSSRGSLNSSQQMLSVTRMAESILSTPSRRPDFMNYNKAQEIAKRKTPSPEQHHQEALYNRLHNQASEKADTIKRRSAWSVSREMAECTFQPNINKDRESTVVFVKPTFERLADTSQRDMQKQGCEEIRQRKEARECTFMPKISRMNESTARSASHERLYAEAQTQRSRKRALEIVSTNSQDIDCPFQPQILSARDRGSHTDIHERLYQIHDKQQKARRMSQVDANQQDLAECTFQPRVNSSDIVREGRVYDSLYDEAMQRKMKEISNSSKYYVPPGGIKKKTPEREKLYKQIKRRIEREREIYERDMNTEEEEPSMENSKEQKKKPSPRIQTDFQRRLTKFMQTKENNKKELENEIYGSLTFSPRILDYKPDTPNIIVTPYEGDFCNEEQPLNFRYTNSNR